MWMANKAKNAAAKHCLLHLSLLILLMCLQYWVELRYEAYVWACFSFKQAQERLKIKRKTYNSIYSVMLTFRVGTVADIHRLCKSALHGNGFRYKFKQVHAISSTPKKIKASHERRCIITLSLKWNWLKWAILKLKTLKTHVKSSSGVSLKVSNWVNGIADKIILSRNWRNKVNVLKPHRWVRSQHSIANAKISEQFTVTWEKAFCFRVFGILGSTPNLWKVLNDANFKP